MLTYIKKMILRKTYYKTYNKKLLIIIEGLKTYYHYFLNCKYKFFVFIDQNILSFFIDI